MGVGPAGNRGGGSSGISTNVLSGEISGQKITEMQFDRAEHDVELWYLFNYGQWPGENVTDKQFLTRIYIQMLMLQKAQELGIHVGDAQAAQAAAGYLRSEALVRGLGVRSDSVPYDALVNQVLARHNPSMDGADFENFVRDDMALDQLRLTFGLPGELVTPEEMTNEYVRANQEYSAQIVFFSASNYLSKVNVTPAEVGQFYTNYMAEYRLPDRVQVSYVLFNVTNFLSEAQTKLEKTNLEQQVNYDYNKFKDHLDQIAPDAKTPDEAKAQIRRIIVRQQALADADQQANDFAQAVFNVSSVQNRQASAQDLVTVARQKGLKVQTPAPFSEEYGPQEFTASPAFIRQAFELTPDSPIPEPVAGPDGVYVMALDQNLPSEIPSLVEIRGRVTRDLEMREAEFFARSMGTNFVRMLGPEMASGKSFAAACIAGGAEPQVLPPFSMSTSDMPELGDHATMNQLREAAFLTRVGVPSNFETTDDGGFVLFIESRLPIDQTRMAEDLPEFAARLRESRAQAAFTEWYNREANRDLRDTPLNR